MVLSPLIQPMTRDISPFALRMPTELRDQVERAATESGRSMNAQIIHLVKQSLDDSPAARASRAMRAAVKSTREASGSSPTGAVRPDLLAAVMTGASRWMEKQTVKVEPARFAEFVALLYGYYEGRESIDETEFDRFMKLLA